jgi:Response regulators consisting of a CheY-like receiver domain and a winged-helix DNA-binding domain
MSVEINSAPGKFPSLVARMLRLELEAVGIAVCEPSQLPQALYIYVDSEGNTELHRQKLRESIKQSADDRIFKYPYRTDAFVAAVAHIITEAVREKTQIPQPEIVQEEDKQNAIQNSEITLSDLERLVTVNGTTVQFTDREYRLFKYLYDRRGNAVGREELVGAVWDDEAGNGTNVVDVYISYLRRKIEGTQLERRIRTRRGQGYEFK